jgi:hypothetical protein
MSLQYFRQKTTLYIEASPRTFDMPTSFLVGYAVQDKGPLTGTTRLEEKIGLINGSADFMGFNHENWWFNGI